MKPTKVAEIKEWLVLLLVKLFFNTNFNSNPFDILVKEEKNSGKKERKVGVVREKRVGKKESKKEGG